MTLKFDGYHNLIFLSVGQLYDHRNESLSDFTHREIENVAYQPAFGATLLSLKYQLLHFLEKDVVFRGPFKS